MITIITEKPNRSVDIIGYGLDSYTDKSGKKIYRVYGTTNYGGRGRYVSRDDKGNISDLYIDDSIIIIFRSEDYKIASKCKDFIDRHVAMKAPVFAVEEFKKWLGENENGEEVEAEAESVEVSADVN